MPPSDNVYSGPEAALARVLEGFFDPEFYRARYPDVVSTQRDPLRHFITWGAAEGRDPNPWFDSMWYSRRYADVGASGIHPLLHYLQAGAAEGRDPHPRFRVAWYVEQHPEAARNPLLFHLRVGKKNGWPTEKPVSIGDYLPVESQPALVDGGDPVDVIIPVYRGLEQTRRCLTSVLDDPDRQKGRMPNGRVIVIDDRSPEPELSAWLDELARGGRIVLHRNRRNLGFVASVNRGMALAGRHDVVLLNSDTEVASGWLHRLAAHARRTPRIASISPFSNNATICGYPGNIGGPMPPGRGVGDMDQACQIANAGRAVDVPTTVGFCMFIARAALDEVGDFDAKTFGRGYGEENDFCLRATALGWRHLLACDTFVYHEGSVSFGTETEVRANQAMDILLQRYPSYLRDVARHANDDAVAPYRFAATAAWMRRSGLPVILMVSHALGGGIPRHIDDVIHRLSGRANVLLLSATPQGVELSVPGLTDHPVLPLAPDRIDDLANWLGAAGISRVHVHHLAGVAMDIRTLIHRLGVPFDVTIHDYYTICPQTNLLPQPDGPYCGEPGPASCNACIANRPAYDAREILSWRRSMNWLFLDAARVLCPSQDTYDRLVRYGLARHAIVAPHEPVAPGPWPVRATMVRGGRLRVVILGTLAAHKGAALVSGLAESDRGETLDLRLIGDVEAGFPAPARPFIAIGGAYDDADLPGLIAEANPHVIWFPAHWPEVYSFTLSAAIAAGLPIAATDIGAFPERLLDRPLTWLAAPDATPGKWLGVFQDIRDSLARRAPADATARRAAAVDFYADAYLDSPKPRARRAKPRKRIVVIPERLGRDVLSPCAYIRLLQPLDHPAIAGDFDVLIAPSVEAALLESADIFATQRYALPGVPAADALAAHARRIGARLLYDIDDDLTRIPADHPDADTLRPRAALVRRMLKHADAVWTSTEALAARLPGTKRPPIVVPNGLDERIWAAAPARERLLHRPIRILCMGTATHDGDYALIEPALERLKSEFGDRVVIDVLGVTSQPRLASGLNRLGVPLQASLSYPGFVNWLTRHPGWDIGLAPLLDTAFNRGKSAIKTLDYAALGLAVLASDVPVYRGSLAEGPGGMLVANDETSWFLALSELVRNPGRCHELGDAALAGFRREGTLGSQAAARRKALAGV